MNINLEALALKGAPRVAKTRSLPDFIAAAQAVSLFDAVIYDRYGLRTQELLLREELVRRFKAYWEKWKPAQGHKPYAVLSHRNITRAWPTLQLDGEIQQDPTLSSEFNNMAQAYEDITGKWEQGIFIIPNSNNPMPWAKERKGPVLLSAWLTREAYYLYPYGNEKGIKVLSGNWVFIRPAMMMDIAEKDFRNPRTRRLVVAIDKALPTSYDL